jgi:transcription termination/antitermination protein NusG
LVTFIKYQNLLIKGLNTTSQWYAIYIGTQCEKKIVKRLHELAILVYLLLLITFRHWSDRKKKVSIPLFSGYVFINTKVKNYYRVLNIPGMVRYISFEGKDSSNSGKPNTYYYEYIGT